MFRKIGKLALLPILAMVVIGCTGEDEKYIGNWSGADQNGNDKMTISLMADSKCKGSINKKGKGERSFNENGCSWNAKEQTINFIGMGFTSPFKLDGNKLLVSKSKGKINPTTKFYHLSK